MPKIIPIYKTLKPIQAIIIAEQMKAHGVNVMTVCDCDDDSVIYVTEDRVAEAQHVLTLII